MCGLVNNVPSCYYEKQGLETLYAGSGVGVWKGEPQAARQLPQDSAHSAAGREAEPFRSHLHAFLPSPHVPPTDLPLRPDSVLWEAPSKHTGAEVPATKDCFPFQMNLRILIEGRCLKLIQCSKHRLSIYYAPRNESESSVGQVGAA